MSVNKSLLVNEAQRFGLGDGLIIQVAGVNMDLLQIDFCLIEQLNCIDKNGDSQMIPSKPTNDKSDTKNERSKSIAENQISQNNLIKIISKLACCAFGQA